VYNGIHKQKGGETMLTKIRTNIFLTRIELKKLRALSRKTGAPVAVLVRRAIDEYMERFERRQKRG
jgi:predicted DNA-binding protein